MISTAAASTYTTDGLEVLRLFETGVDEQRGLLFTAEEVDRHRHVT